MTEPTNAGVRRASESLAREHRELLQKAERLAATRSLAELLPQLEHMHSELSAHFAHEQYPEGLYEQLGLSGEEHHGILHELIDEHFHMIARLHALIALARYAGADGAEEVLRRTAALVEELRAHERKERALVLSVLDG